jgi:hypothetical protein
MHFLVNFAAFQIGWFSAVLGAANGMPWLGPLAFVGVLAIHLRLVSRPDLEVGLVIASGVIGFYFDSLLVANGWVTYPSGLVSESFAPYWIVTMWMLFATTLNVSMRWLRDRRAMAAVFGAIGGPLSYVAGEKLGGIVFVDQLAALLALAIGWGIAMPVLMELSKRLDGVRKSQQPQEAR